MKYSGEILSLILSCFFIACNSNNNGKIHSNNSIKPCGQSVVSGVVHGANCNLRYDDYDIIKDTLRINSDDDFLDYPFGCYKKIADLRSSLKNFHYKQECYDDRDKIKLERFYSGRNYIKFYFVERFIDNKSRYEIVSAKIFDDSIKLVNGVHIGMLKNEFFSIIPSSIKYNNEEINVVEFCWDVLGVYHYYSFNNDTLTSIVIDTDFLVNKN